MLLTSANTSPKPPIPSVRIEGSGAPVQGAVLRPFYGSPGVYQDHGAHLVDSTQKGHPSPPVSGRLASSSRVTTKDLQWWAQEPNLLVGQALREGSPDFLLYTDASREGWGCSLLQHCGWVVVHGRSGFPHQPAGVEGRQASFSPLRVTSTRQDSGGIRRQHHSSCLPDTSRRDSFFAP